MHLTHFLQAFKDSSKRLRWFIDDEGSVRAKLGTTLFTPVTGVSYFLTGKKNKSLDFHYSAAEIDLDIGTALWIERASDDIRTELSNTTSKITRQGILSVLNCKYNS